MLAVDVGRDAIRVDRRSCFGVFEIVVRDRSRHPVQGNCHARHRRVHRRVCSIRNSSSERGSTIIIVRFTTRIRELVERDCIMSNVSVFSMNRILDKESIASTRGARHE